MKVIELTKGQVAIVDDEDFEYLAQWRWYFNPTTKGGEGFGYAVRMAPNEYNPRRKIWMHLEILKPPSGMQGDHKNGNSLDNRRCNLRLATAAQNTQNRRCFSNNKCGVKGVSPHVKGFTANINVNGKRRYLGKFKTVEEAKAVYDLAAIDLHKEFARLN